MRRVNPSGHRISREDREAPALPRPLHRLARVYGVRTTFLDGLDRRRTAKAEAVVAVLNALGAPIQRIDDAPEALAWKRSHDSQQFVDPVQVAWNGAFAPASLSAGASRETAHIEYQIVIEGANEVVAGVIAPGTPPTGSAELVHELPMGYHRLHVRAGRRESEAIVISAPPHCYGADLSSRDFGLFAPWYALHSRRTRGIGDLGELQALSSWAAQSGCTLLGTLPMLATYLDEPFEPSPYSPISRCFWNELIIDLAAVAGADHGSPDALHAGNGSEALVDYRAAARRKRSALEQAVRSEAARAEIAALAAAKPELRRYAQFRAATDRLRSAWPQWPERMRDGDLRDGDYDSRDFEYHVFAQHAAGRQLASCADDMRRSGVQLYLDLPLGVHGGGYDTWRHRGCFASGVAVGSPPDVFFTRGQNWGFPPPIPQAMRQTGHAWFVDSLRVHMRVAQVLRLDHVMGLHRLFWIPHGFDGGDGMYVHYPADELYAMLCLESHRFRSRVVGENLGTVPRAVDRALHRRGVLGMHVGLFEFDGDAEQPMKAPPRQSLASLDTHDTATFAAFWAGHDVQIRLKLGLIDEAGAVKERAERDALRSAIGPALAAAAGRRAEGEIDTATAFAGAMALLAESEAAIVLASLEDFWLELEPQNVPGTSDREHPNWRRRLRRSMEKLACDRSLQSQIRALAQRRHGAAPRLASPSRAAAP